MRLPTLVTVLAATAALTLAACAAPASPGSPLDTSGGGFFFELSYEQLDKLDADIVISYHGSEAEAAEFLTKPALQAIPAVKAGRVAQVTDPVAVSSVSPPTALTFDWDGGLPALVEKLSVAAGK